MSDIEKHLSSGMPYEKAINCTAETTMRFIEMLFGPAAEEIGLFLSDKVRIWRINNFVKIAEKTQRILEEKGFSGTQKANPRIAIKVLQEGSCNEDANLQEMWAGLLASSCNKDGSDEANLIFLNILQQLSRTQARIINHLVPESMRRFYARTQDSNPVKIARAELYEITGLNDPAILERELNHLGVLGLTNLQTLQGPNHEISYNITIDDVALRFCACCAGYRSECYVEWTELYKE